MEQRRKASARYNEKKRLARGFTPTLFPELPLTIDDDDAKIIDFARAKDERADSPAPFIQAPFRSRLGECLHKHGFLVDPKDHEVTCRKCGKAIDPFKAIWEITLSWNWKRAHEEKAALSGEIDRLTKERDALKALVSRARANAPLPGKQVRKALKQQAELFKRRAAMCRSCDDRKGEEAWLSASHLLVKSADDMVRQSADSAGSGDD